MGEVIAFPAPRRLPDEPAALDRLIAEIDGRGGRRAVCDAVADRPPRRPSATVVPFRLADR